VDELRTAAELDPLNAEYLKTLGGILMEANRPVEAEKQLKAAVGLDPASDTAHISLAKLYERDKRYADAINEATSAFFLRGQRDQALKIKAVYEKSGYEAAKQAALREHLDYLLNLRKERYVSPYEIASIYAHLGEKTESLTWLQEAYDQRDVALPCLKQAQYEVFASLRNEPQFQTILKSVHFPD
jgi:tetratricopeptide (TPR) repeat protein